ncbi:MAG: endopeptidase La [Firmicutes bacterium HGW-Firmicutes-1]|jgi:ATP-dependent Lon protease|nr:MAG: endopeptidase La [Firmicutes bacterium HGW-Firmicutes-1]
MNPKSYIVDLPVLALRGINLFPDMVMHFDVKREKSIEALEFAMQKNQMVFLVAQKEAHLEEPNPKEDLYEQGTVARIKQMIKLPKNIVRLLVVGEKRGSILSITQEEPYIVADIQVKDEEEVEIIDAQKSALLSMAREMIEEFSKMNPTFANETVAKMLMIEDIGKIADAIGYNLIGSLDNKQSLLSNDDPISRLKLAITILNAEIEIVKIKRDINDQVKVKIDKNQKDYFLREQIKVIQNELGEQQSIEEEIDEYVQKTKNIKASEEVVQRLEKEINRLKKIPLGSAEGTVSRNYIEWLLDMPWDHRTIEATDLETAENILNEDHYGLEKVKERVLEHLAVRKLSEKTDSPIICLVGPPGTGKTSIAKSIARALNRSYSRISLGGVRDEAEIRGHRKTYVGAMPGRIVNALKYSRTSNPLILLDEIDKMTSDMRGDPSSALLEVLDGEQNSKFRDHYVEVSVDLSDVLFIATANSLRNIPKALLDRLELIEVSSYTENEKVHIASRFLIPKQKEKHGIPIEQLMISEQAITRIINEYTKEAGVRNLERKIGEICRKVAKLIDADQKMAHKITEKNIKTFLGTPLYRFDMVSEKPQIGIARGLAWTEVGGDTLSIEVNVMNGTGKFDLTGQLGDVMKESAKAAISFIRSMSELIENMPEDFYEKKDIHIHIPEGAVPKDGPSAGITMAVAMISALTNHPVSHEVAMTGEITLRGRVLPIGGLKEKLLAAKRAGIKKVIVPEDNKRNIAEINKEILKGLNIVYVSNMNQVLKEALIDINQEEQNACK